MKATVLCQQQVSFINMSNKLQGGQTIFHFICLKCDYQVRIMLKYIHQSFPKHGSFWVMIYASLVFAANFSVIRWPPCRHDMQIGFIKVPPVCVVHVISNHVYTIQFKRKIQRGVNRFYTYFFIFSHCERCLRKQMVPDNVVRYISICVYINWPFHAVSLKSNIFSRLRSNSSFLNHNL